MGRSRSGGHSGYWSWRLPAPLCHRWHSGVRVLPRQFVHRKQWLLLRAPGTDSLIEYYAKLIRASVPNGDALRAHASALAATCFGEFDRADAIMASVAWSGRGDLYEALPLHVRALTAALARSQLERVWRSPRAGATWQRRLAVCQVPRRHGFPGTFSFRLERSLRMPDARDDRAARNRPGEAPFLSGLLASWGLAVPISAPAVRREPLHCFRN